MAPTVKSKSVLRSSVLTLLLVAGAGTATAAEPSADYRQPSAAVTALLTAPTPPEPLLHARSGLVALLYREPVMSMERLARPRLGLAGFRFDPESQTSGVGPLITRVDLVSANAPDRKPLTWTPAGGAVLDFVHFSPDGRTLSAIAIASGPARLVLFDTSTGRERVIDAAVNAAWGDPCHWTGNDELLCRVLPDDRGAAPADRPAPIVVEHFGSAVPIRTYQNTLQNAYEDALFEYYFVEQLARIARSGESEIVPGLRGLYSSVDPSPDGRYVIVTHVDRPYSRLVPAYRFPSSVELWDLAKGTRLYASKPAGFGLENDPEDEDRPRRGEWLPGTTSAIGFLETVRDADGDPTYRWMTLAAPFHGEPVLVAESELPILRFGWTTAGTPLYATRGTTETEVSYQVVFEEGTRTLWSGAAMNQYENPGHALRLDGAEGPMLEANGRIYLAGDGQGDGGPRPFLDALDLRKRTTERVFLAEPGEFEVVLGLLDPEGPAFITSRESETESPNLYLVRGQERRQLTDIPDPFPQLERATRRVVTYQRGDGVGLSGTLYLPAGYREGTRLPTLVWIYPYEFTDREQAEQLDLRSFRFHRVKGPSPLAAVVAGYAVLLNPTVPILYEGDAPTDNYIPQLVASVEAAVDHLVEIGVTDPARVAVAGRSFGSFSSANLMIHSDRFATAVLMSGAYNRTLTPFGFQHEHRSFWEVTDLYTKISPFFYADQFKGPVLLVHGGSDENAGTPPFQARRMFHALMGAGGAARFVELPYEGHHYWGRDNVLLASAEMLDWLDRTIGPQAAGKAADD
jgi:dipeptidyl aminopeptidase/acylaminoacyl peptidase